MHVHTDVRGLLWQTSFAVECLLQGVNMLVHVYFTGHQRLCFCLARSSCNTALAGDTFEIRSCMVLESALIIVLWDRNHLRQIVYNAHIHELIWRPIFHFECLAQGANMHIVHIVGSTTQKIKDQCNLPRGKIFALVHSCVPHHWCVKNNWLAGF